VRVIAPASPFSRQQFDAGVARLRARYHVSFEPDIFAVEGYFAGSDARRLRELSNALSDSSVDAIVAARGGYGATRLLEHIRVDDVRDARKLLVGFSDLTALHALWARAGLRSLHAPMVAGLGRAPLSHVERWIAATEGALAPPLVGLRTLSPGKAEGPLLGGNLAVLSALLGTPFMPPLQGAVLFLEDVAEAPYRVDRMLTSLRHAALGVAGIAVGQFSGCRPREDGRRVEEVLEDRLGDLGIPVLARIGAGHVDDNLELPFGALVRLDADRGVLTFLEPAARV
jgi:muramoyltetrapeptide carboxypeptidase